MLCSGRRRGAALSVLPLFPDAVGMPKSALGEYKALQSHLLEATKSLQPFTSDAPSKKYRFDLQKAVTLNVNAISAQSGQQVLDKLSNIKRLLRKQPVEVSGKKVSTNDHPLAYLFCCNLLAKKFVVSTLVHVCVLSSRYRMCACGCVCRCVCMCVCVHLSSNTSRVVSPNKTGLFFFHF